MISRRKVTAAAAAAVLLGSIATAASAAGSTPDWTATCPSHASTSAPGCGSWDNGPSSGTVPGFLPGTAANPNLISVSQDGWTASQGLQVLTADSYHGWTVTATDSDPSNAPGEVLTYPDASFNYYQLDTAPDYDAPPLGYDLNKIGTLVSSFTQSMPPTGDSYIAEAAYDVWLNNWQTEVMFWVDSHKNTNLAVDGCTKVGTYTYSGQTWVLWRNGSGINAFYAFVLSKNETSGTVHLWAMLEELVQLKEIPADSPLTQVPFGWEISDTAGHALKFSVSRLTLSVAGR
jgi:hypothetical protein